MAREQVDKLVEYLKAMERGAKSLSVGDPNEARRAFRDALDIVPGNPMAAQGVMIADQMRGGGNNPFFGGKGFGRFGKRDRDR
jgi:hypothetical protein